MIGAARLGERIGEPNVLYLDIGGTTAKCSLIEDGEPKTTTEYRIEWRPDYAGYPILVPVVDIVEIGAGGGSIAWIDAGGSVRVGPRSAGADPGPACYGRGGKRPDRHRREARGRACSIPSTSWAVASVCSPALAEQALRDLGRPLGLDAGGAGERDHQARQREHDQRAQARLGPARLRLA